MKKLNNKGFSLVELIIVIAIMAVLAGALAPALITYIEKSRISTDKQTADTIRSAIQSALADDTIYDETIGDKDITGTFDPATNTGKGLTLSGTKDGKTDATQPCAKQVNTNVKPSNVKIKSKKAWNEKSYTVEITKDGDVRVYLTYNDNAEKYGAVKDACSDTMKKNDTSSSSSSTT